MPVETSTRGRWWPRRSACRRRPTSCAAGGPAHGVRPPRSTWTPSDEADRTGAMPVGAPLIAQRLQQRCRRDMLAAVAAPALTPPRPSRLSRVRNGLTRGEWTAILGMAGFIALLHIVGWGVLAAVIAPHHYVVGNNQVFGVGLGITAYALGMRHAF